MLTISIVALFWNLEGLGGDFKPRHGYTFRVFPDVKVKAQTKTVRAAFPLNNREDKCELIVYNNDRLLPFCPISTYLGIKLDRSLTCCHNPVALCNELSSRVTLLRQLVDSGGVLVPNSGRFSFLGRFSFSY